MTDPMLFAPPIFVAFSTPTAGIILGKPRLGNMKLPRGGKAARLRLLGPHASVKASAGKEGTSNSPCLAGSPAPGYGCLS